MLTLQKVKAELNIRVSRVPKGLALFEPEENAREALLSMVCKSPLLPS